MRRLPLADRALDRPHESRLPITHPARDAIIAAHNDALTREADGYLDPVTGFWVFTSAHLARRETCCESSCRHCPYVC